MALLTARNAALAMCLLALAGCSTVKYVRELPPPELLEDCKATQSEVKTNAQLALALLAARDDLAKCNIDKRSLREWAKQ